ncbi:beta-galactosidase [Caulobacter sp. Root656]|nr:beta-galactosidase [Caulobacter sp. Root656]
MRGILSGSILGRLCAVLCLFLALSGPAAAASRIDRPFNDGWRMATGDIAGAEKPEFDDAAWKPVTLPRTWNEDEAFKVDIHDLKGGITWYRKRFILPSGVGPAVGGKAFLTFEGVRQAGDVYVNGVLVGGHENGVTAFGVDATKALKPAPYVNVVAVRVDSDWKYKERATGSGFQWNNDNFNVNYGGIHRAVRLVLTDGLHQTLPLYSSLGTTGVYVWADAFDIKGGAASVHAESQVRNASDQPRTFRYRVTLKDVDGKLAGAFDGPTVTLAAGETRTVSAQAPLKGLKFWSWGYGYLYAVTTELVEDGASVDAVVTRTGFRKTQFRNGMIFLNDRVMQVHGYAQRTSNEWPALGTDIPPWISDFSNALMVESGGNLVRWMHIAPAAQDVESADRVGLLQAMPAGDAESDVTGRRWEQRVEVMRDAIVRFRNNPSILFYEGGNENISDEHMAELKAVRDQFDPHGGRAIGSREMLASKVAEYGGEMLYINKSGTKPVWAMEYSRDEAARKFQDDFTPPFHIDSPDYNRNQDSHAAEDVRRWFDYWRERPGGGDRVSSGGVNIIFSDSNTHFRGDNNYRRSGEVDAMRLPKEGFYAHQVMWDGWVDVERPRSHIIGHWNYAPGVTKDVLVVSSADRVELLLNGKSLGQGVKSDGFLFTFKAVAWAPGTLRAVGRDAAGKVVSSDERVTTGPAVALRLTPHVGPTGWRADAADLALVDVEALDAQGRRVPTALDLVSFDVVGPAEWRGGIAQGDSKGGVKPTQAPASPTGDVVTGAHTVDGVTSYAGASRGDDNYILSRTLPVEAGINRVALRSTLEPGKVTVTARAEGLKPATVTLDVAPPPAVEPLLPVSLARGPTPATPSFKVRRVALRPVATLAGSNPDTVGLARDDDETTHWASDGQLANAWIEYQLDKPQVVDEVVLKLIGWRLRSYPLRVTVDGVTVYEGAPAKSLGYVTLPLKPVKGRRLRIALTGPTVDRDAFGKIVEITGAKAGLDTGAEKVAAGGGLGIIEAELYRRP